jgi:hypothetical protein
MCAGEEEWLLERPIKDREQRPEAQAGQSRPIQPVGELVA